MVVIRNISAIIRYVEKQGELVEEVPRNFNHNACI